MIAHEAIDITTRMASSVLRDRIALGDEVGEAGVRGIGVQGHLSSSKSIGMKAQPATGRPFSV